MLNYELAKKLEQMGFPLEACGNDFVMKNSNDTKLDGSVEWFAGKGNYDKPIGMASGSTPEEAVARLYIALNKN